MNFYQEWCVKKARIKAIRLEKFYDSNQLKILDIGSGNGALCLLLRKRGMEVTPLDINNRSAFAEIVPILYDGTILPFEDDSFDLVQLITVLHHIEDPEWTVREAARVGKKVIIMEDIYDNLFQKFLTYITDSINNWEFKGHPHSNKNDKEWRALFDYHDLELESVEYYKFLLFFKQVTYKIATPNYK